ncbi:hypothetical protein BWQ96_00560 [Gracilariopsis chorda]|uniref:Uncharacterized protein n=1 Tax=Gracilariopsis chorda TaxID=448386 RepID=A0A2V3J6C9_9FLOR|nr:hypothetical protein BWQ96_00560 [Gracilariopsis chorda]|eukprot:PXF49682.1 hypothetical protein BWQ96_00560 [Gracilariopsis chorda]
MYQHFFDISQGYIAESGRLRLTRQPYIILLKMSKKEYRTHSFTNMHNEQCDSSLRSVLRDMTTAKSADDAAACCNSLRIIVCDFQTDVNGLQQSADHALKLMKAHATDLRVQKCATLALIVLCEQQRMAAYIGQIGAMQHLVEIGNTFLKDEALVKNVVLLMRSLVILEPNRINFCEHGGIGMLTSAMIEFPARASLQCSATALIASICYESESRRLLVTANGIVPLLIRILVRFQESGNGKVLSNACMALRNISLESIACEEILFHDSSLRNVCSIVVAESAPSAAEEAIGVCLNIVTVLECIKDTAELHKIVQTVLHAVIKFMSKTAMSFRTHVKCHELAFGLLRVCQSLPAENKDTKVKSEILRLTVTYAIEYTTNGSSRSVQVVSSVCILIRKMVIDACSRKTFGEIPQSIPTLVRCVAFLKNHPTHVEQSLLALGNAVFDAPVGKLRACESGALRIIGETMKANKNAAAVSESGLMAIQALCIDSDKMGTVASSLRFHDLCVLAIKTFEESPTIQERGLAAIISMGCGQQAMKNIHASEALDAADRAVSLYPCSNSIVALCAKLHAMVGTEKDVFKDQTRALRERSYSIDAHSRYTDQKEDEKSQDTGKKGGRESFPSRILSKLPSRHRPKNKSE